MPVPAAPPEAPVPGADAVISPETPMVEVVSRVMFT